MLVVRTHAAKRKCHKCQDECVSNILVLSASCGRSVPGWFVRHQPRPAAVPLKWTPHTHTHKYTLMQSSPDPSHSYKETASFNTHTHTLLLLFSPLNELSLTFSLLAGPHTQKHTHSLCSLFFQPVIMIATALCTVTTLPPTYTLWWFTPWYGLSQPPSISLLSLRIVLRSIISEFAYTVG